MKIRTTLFVATLSLGAALSATAQGVYRIVGPDGRVTFSDQPPPATGAGRTQGQGPAAAPAASSGGGGAALPFELRQTAARYPVVLYTGKDCAPCNSGRNLLNARGIPYTEKTVTSQEDAEALRRLAGEASLPFLTIGSQRLRGFSDLEWTQYLTAAGYPTQSALPPGYRRAPPSALVEVAPAGAAAPAPGTARADDPPAAPAEVPVVPPANNPAGIRF